METEYYAPKMASTPMQRLSLMQALTQRDNIDDTFLTKPEEESVDLDSTDEGEVQESPFTIPIEPPQQVVPSPRTAAKQEENRAARKQSKALAYAMKQLHN